MRKFSLHNLSVLDVAPHELVEVAARLGCDYVCTFVDKPEGIPLPVVSDADVEPLRRQLRDAGVGLLCTSSFPLEPGVDVSVHEGGLGRAERLGGRYANCRIIDEDEARATGSFARFAELCEAHGLIPVIEPMGYGNTEAFPQAVRMIKAAGRGTLTLDPLHIIRTGTSWDYIEALDPALTGYIQLCDGPLVGDTEGYLMTEGLYDRLPLGEGEYPLERLINIASPDQPFALEIPCQQLRAQGFPAGRDLIAEVARRSIAWYNAQSFASSSSPAP